MREVTHLGRFRDGKFEPSRNTHVFLLDDFTQGGRFSRGPELSDVWVFKDGERVFTVFKGDPPTLRWYPDLDTALVAYTLKS